MKVGDRVICTARDGMGIEGTIIRISEIDRTFPYLVLLDRKCQLDKYSTDKVWKSTKTVRAI